MHTFMNVQGKLFDLKREEDEKSVEHEEGKHAVRKYLQQDLEDAAILLVYTH